MKKILLLLFLCTAIMLTAQVPFSLDSFPQDKVMVVAHRGNWREAPENSIWAVKKALEAGASMAEIDLQSPKIVFLF